MARSAATAFQQQAQIKAISLQIDAPDSVVSQADEDRIGQIIRNLVSNAISYTPSHGQVGIRARIEGEQAVLVVRDDGPGIPPEDLPYVFERFYRVDKSRSRYTGGVGLGLTIARRLTEAHGGDISVTSQEGEGSEFRVVFPVNGADLNGQAMGFP